MYATIDAVCDTDWKCLLPRVLPLVSIIYSCFSGECFPRLLVVLAHLFFISLEFLHPIPFLLYAPTRPPLALTYWGFLSYETPKARQPHLWHYTPNFMKPAYPTRTGWIVSLFRQHNTRTLFFINQLIASRATKTRIGKQRRKHQGTTHVPR